MVGSVPFTLILHFVCKLNSLVVRKSSCFFPSAARFSKLQERHCWRYLIAQRLCMWTFLAVDHVNSQYYLLFCADRWASRVALSLQQLVSRRLARPLLRYSAPPSGAPAASAAVSALKQPRCIGGKYLSEYRV